MRTLIILALTLFFQATAEASDYSGLWFRCRTYDFELLEISKVNNSYKWLSEWGPAYSASGTATLLPSGDLILKGCKSFRGELSKDCDDTSPPEFLRLSRQLIKKPNKASNNALQRGVWLRTSDKTWTDLESRCIHLQAAGNN